MNILHGKPSIQTNRELLDQFSDNDFAKPSRSTVPLLDYWLHGDGRAKNFLESVGLPPETDQATLCFEYPVASLDGKAKSSFTDLMILLPSTAVAVEAKWTEGKYPSVKKWIENGNRKRRRKVIAHWLNLIQPFAHRDLDVDDFENDKIVYQSIHRTASACSAAAGQRGKAVVVYQIFDAGRVPSNYQAMLKLLVEALQPKSELEFWIVMTPMEPTQSFKDRKESCGKDKAKNAGLIRSSLNEGGLFDYDGLRVERIGDVVLPAPK
jgi:hypothetical protein